jgi:rfaE bifunctional protein nucleotidyltransferase chain/domain/rfaE bifunctional protein kinase chain/domain
MTAPGPRHVASLLEVLPTLDCARLSRWGAWLATALPGGARLLVAGNGGSAAQAQHLSAELVGRFSADRQALSALALHADTSAMTAVGNDFGFAETFARQVRAHGRPGDILVALSTSGTSENVRRAVRAAAEVGMTTWALTGPGPNPLAQACDDYVAVSGGSVATIQECHLVAIHLICAAVDDLLSPAADTSPAAGRDSPAAVPPVPAPAAPLPPAPAPARPAPGPRPADRPALTRRSPARLVIVGDALLDTEITGETSRISPEAPVPVVGAPRQAERPGGAGMAALLAAGDGHQVTLITALGTDEAARTVTDRLAEAGVRIINLGTPAPTAVKTRIRSRGQTMLMLDHATEPPSPGPLPDEGRAAIRSASAVLVSDYGRGVAAAADVRRALSEALGGARVVWDPHPRGPAPVSGVTAVTPNSREALHFAPDAAAEGLDADIGRGRRLLRAWDVGHVVITRGAEGAVVVSDDAAPPLVIPAPSAVTGDSCGAGDRFAVALTAALAAGSLPLAAATGAVRAASQFVAAMAAGAGRGPDGPRDGEDATAFAARVRAAGGTVVAAGGCFDLLHRGHVTLLQQARKLGDCLVVCLNSDASVTRLKGPGRPLVTAADRAAVLEALSCVDRVIVFGEDTPEQVLGRLRPHVYVKGGDYALADLPERAVIERDGGHVVFLPYLDGRSSTALVNRAAGQGSRC